MSGLLLSLTDKCSFIKLRMILSRWESSQWTKLRMSPLLMWRWLEISWSWLIAREKSSITLSKITAQSLSTNPRIQSRKYSPTLQEPRWFAWTAQEMVTFITQLMILKCLYQTSLHLPTRSFGMLMIPTYLWQWIQKRCKPIFLVLSVSKAQQLFICQSTWS